MPAPSISQDRLRRLPAALLMALLLTGVPAAAPVAGAQDVPGPVFVRTHAEWRTLRGDGFVLHYPREMEAWARHAAARLPVLHAAVAAEAGAHREPVRIILDETGHLSGGMSFPMGSLILLWPRWNQPLIGRAHDRPEALLVHELAHKASGAASRSPSERRWRARVPPPWNVPPGALGEPDWLNEGYPSHVEGRVVGGLPQAPMRAAFLRLATAGGGLPALDSLDRPAGLAGGRAAYAVGSAFLDWLVDEHGPQAIPAVWARRAEGAGRDEAFASVMGARPEELYRRFAAVVAARARAVERWLGETGEAGGEVVELPAAPTGAPAVSRDGRLLAVTLRGEGRPPRLEVLEPAEGGWRTLAVLPHHRGRAHTEPRFLPDGRLLVLREEPRPDGTLRPDLFLWDWRSGALRRLTRGAGIHAFDPAPDGRRVVAERCAAGTCEVVLVDASGVSRTLAAGSPGRSYGRPRWSPDGREIVAGRNDDGVWRVVALDPQGGAERVIGPDDGISRYQPAFTPQGEVVAVSERGGVQNLVRLTPGGREELLTRVLGGAVAPVPLSDGGLLFLSYTARGFVLARLPVGSPVLAEPHAPPPGGLRPALPQESPEPAAGAAPLPAPSDQPYGFGPRQLGFLPLLVSASGESNFGLAVSSNDPVGRFSLLLQGALPLEGGAPAGAALAGRWRGWPVHLEGELFALRGYRGGTIRLERRTLVEPLTSWLELGVGGGKASSAGEGHVTRVLAFAGGRVALLGAGGGGGSRTEVRADLRAGLSGGERWRRLAGGATLARSWRRAGIEADVEVGWSGSRPVLGEAFVVGGAGSPLLERAQQRFLADAPLLAPREREGAALLGRVALTGLPLAPTLWWEPDAGRWAAGVERTFTAPHLPFALLPGVTSARLGGGYASEEDARAWRAYLRVSYRP